MRVALADDSVLFRRGLAALLSSAGVDVTHQVATGAELLAVTATEPPDVVIVDIRMPPTFTAEGLDTADMMRARHPGVGILVLSTYSRTSYALRLFRNGASGLGYLLKDHVENVGTLLGALDRLRAGESVMDPEIVTALLERKASLHQLERLSPRERDILRLMAEGRSNAGIGSELYLSAKTVEAYTASAFTKLGLPPSPQDNRRVLAVLTWLRALEAG